MRPRPFRTLLIALLAALAAILWFRWMASAPADPPAAPPPSDTNVGGAAAPAPAREEEPEPPAAAPDPAAGELGSAWASVDLEEIRRVMPDNLYWQVAMPTEDARVLRDREDERARWNVEYGKVLSGNASEAEIMAYYAHRQRLSADYVEFTSYVLDQHGDDLSEQDVELLELARRLHLARLEEYPRQQQEAFDRKRKQDQARADWLADQEAFGEKAPQ
ncbi:MAG TPA: hypothetical protein VII72_01300 [Myxococcota bacterium]|jgi:hypothetical protein